MPFINERLLDKVAYGFSGGPTWATTRVSLISGRSKRNAERSQPLHRYSAPFQNIKPEHYDLLIENYMVCLGPQSSFRFKPPTDFTLNDGIIGTAVGGTDETMQLIKPYSFGPVGGEILLNRNITKPVDSTVYTDAVALTLTEDDVGMSFTVDYETGIVTFTSTIGKVIRATGEFDVPVHFDEDSMDFDYSTLLSLSGDIILLEDFGA